RKAFEHPDEIDENKVNAQQARRILDRIVGYCLSPFLWNKVRRGLSAGRVQSVAVRISVEREREIENFEREEYWEIYADLSPLCRQPGKPKQFRAKLARLDGEAAKISNETEAAKLTDELRAAEFIVARVEDKERLLQPPPPFNTSTMQQQASIRLRFRAKKTMAIAQQLYEGVELGREGSVGLITYMRTDSFRVSGQAIAECRDYIEGTFSKDYLPPKARQYRSGRAAQGAHEATRPTSVARTPEIVKPFLPRDLYRLYELIWKRFVASQMNPGRLAASDVEITAGRATFTVQGRQLIFEGHLRLTGFDKKSELRLPRLASGDRLKLLALDPSQHFTKPSPRYTE
ncbi:MAG: DNA topoisomerase, partial [Planctomycetia bacterium]|nr:DNA topoisomerase [Planctomycetia bacterium]